MRVFGTGGGLSGVPKWPGDRIGTGGGLSVSSEVVS